MYYRLKYGKYYLIKIAVLLVITVLAELFIIGAMFKEDNVDWLVGQVVHNPWPYAITTIEDGRTIVGNVVQGFEITLPVSWQVGRTHHPSFYLYQGEEIICDIKSDAIHFKDIDEAKEFFYDQPRNSQLYVGGWPAISYLVTTIENNSINKLSILVEGDIVSYTLFTDLENKYICQQEFTRIRRSFLYY